MIDAAGESESHGVRCFLLLFALLAAHQLALNLLFPAAKQQQLLSLSLSQTDREQTCQTVRILRLKYTGTICHTESWRRL